MTQLHFLYPVACIYLIIYQFKLNSLFVLYLGKSDLRSAFELPSNLAICYKITRYLGLVWDS